MTKREDQEVEVSGFPRVVQTDALLDGVIRLAGGVVGLSLEADLHHACCCWREHARLVLGRVWDIGQIMQLRVAASKSVSHRMLPAKITGMYPLFFSQAVSLVL